MGFQHWRLISRVQAKEIINPRGPPVFKLHFFGWQWSLINRAVLINPNLDILVMMDILVIMDICF